MAVRVDLDKGLCFARVKPDFHQMNKMPTLTTVAADFVTRGGLT